MIEKWLEKDWSEENVGILAIIFSIACFIYALFFCFFNAIVFKNFFLPITYFADFWEYFTLYRWKTIFILLFFGALEDVIWRALPLSLGYILVKKKNYLSDWMLLSIAIIFSLGFALSHKSNFNLLIQWPMGIAWSLIFLMAGGYQGKFLRGLIATIISHWLYNIILLITGAIFVLF